MSPRTIEAASRTITRFRIGGSIIAMIPLIYAFIALLGGHAVASAPFVAVSVALLLLVLWICHCAGQFIRTLQSEVTGPNATATERAG